MTKTFLIALVILIIFSISKFFILGAMFKLFKPTEMTDEQKQAFDREFDGLDEEETEDESVF